MRRRNDPYRNFRPAGIVSSTGPVSDDGLPAVGHPLLFGFPNSIRFPGSWKNGMEKGDRMDCSGFRLRIAIPYLSGAYP